jgi:hypothetical protein
MTIYGGQKHTIICNFSYLCEATWHLDETQYPLLLNFGKTKGTTWPYCFGNQYMSIMDGLWTKMHKTCEHVWVVWYNNTNDIYFDFSPRFDMYLITLVDSMLIIYIFKCWFFFPNEKKMWRQILKLSKLIDLSTKMCWSYQGITICFYIAYNWFKVHIIYMLFKIQLQKKNIKHDSLMN